MVYLYTIILYYYFYICISLLLISQALGSRKLHGNNRIIPLGSVIFLMSCIGDLRSEPHGLYLNNGHKLVILI